jgi:hypothetical protein
MGGAAGGNVAAITFRVDFDITRFQFVSATNGSFGTVTANTSQANSAGRIDVSVFAAQGTTTTTTLYTITLQALGTGSTVTSPVTGTVSAGGNEAGSSVTITPRNLTVTISP